MKKIFLLLCVSLGLLSCESDDICTDKVITPRLIIRAYDKTAPTRLKPINNLLIVGKDSPDNAAIQLATTDSIVVPLRMLAEQTDFLLVKDAVVTNGILTSGEQTEIQIQYKPQTTFVDKGCGYKVIYTEITAQKPSTSWLDSVRVLVNKIEDESKAIIHIYH